MVSFKLFTERTGGTVRQAKSYISNRKVVLKKKGTRLLHLFPADVLVRRFPHEHLEHPDKMEVRVAGNLGEVVEGDPDVQMMIYIIRYPPNTSSMINDSISRVHAFPGTSLM